MCVWVSSFFSLFSRFVFQFRIYVCCIYMHDQTKRLNKSTKRKYTFSVCPMTSLFISIGIFIALLFVAVCVFRWCRWWWWWWCCCCYLFMSSVEVQMMDSALPYSTHGTQFLADLYACLACICLSVLCFIFASVSRLFSFSLASRVYLRESQIISLITSFIRWMRSYGWHTYTVASTLTCDCMLCT